MKCEGVKSGKVFGAAGVRPISWLYFRVFLKHTHTQTSLDIVIVFTEEKRNQKELGTADIRQKRQRERQQMH